MYTLLSAPTSRRSSTESLRQKSRSIESNLANFVEESRELLDEATNIPTDFVPLQGTERNSGPLVSSYPERSLGYYRDLSFPGFGSVESFKEFPSRLNVVQEMENAKSFLNESRREAMESTAFVAELDNTFAGLRQQIAGLSARWLAGERLEDTPSAQVTNEKPLFPSIPSPSPRAEGAIPKKLKVKSNQSKKSKKVKVLSNVVIAPAQRGQNVESTELIQALLNRIADLEKAFAKLTGSQI